MRPQSRLLKSGGSATAWLVEIEFIVACFLRFEHDLIGKPVPTFPDHALVSAPIPIASGLYTA